MSKSDYFLGPPRDLTRDELNALLDVKAGIRLSGQLCYKLELRDLFENGLPGMKLTTTGASRLASGK